MFQLFHFLCTGDPPPQKKKSLYMFISLQMDIKDPPQISVFCCCIFFKSLDKHNCTDIIQFCVTLDHIYEVILNHNSSIPLKTYIYTVIIWFYFISFCNFFKKLFIIILILIFIQTTSNHFDYSSVLSPV